MNLVPVCLVAFLTVMTVLSILAVSIRLLTRFFDVEPEPAHTADASTVAAIQAAVGRSYPCARLVRVEFETEK